LARRAHTTAFADHVVIGWDIAILSEGPCLIEGNKGPDLDLVQRSHAEPLGNTRLGVLLAYNMLCSLKAKYGEIDPTVWAILRESGGGAFERPF